MRVVLGLFLALCLFSCKKEDMPDPPMSGYLWPQTQCAGKFLDLRRTHPNDDPRQQLTVSYLPVERYNARFLPSKTVTVRLRNKKAPPQCCGRA